MKSEEILKSLNIKPDTYPADAIFYNESYIGTYTRAREMVCIMIADNVEDETNLDACILPYEAVKEIAYTVKYLITDFGIDVHSYTMKTTKPFINLQVIKTHELIALSKQIKKLKNQIINH